MALHDEPMLCRSLGEDCRLRINGDPGGIVKRGQPSVELLDELNRVKPMVERVEEAERRVEEVEEMIKEVKKLE